MGAHHAQHVHQSHGHQAPSTALATTAIATRVVATATAAVALTGAGAGLASAHDGSDGDQGGSDYRQQQFDDTAGQDSCRSDGSADGSFDAIGLSPDESAGTCADPSSLGGLASNQSFDDGSGDRSYDGRMSDPGGSAQSAVQPVAQGGQTPQVRPAASPAPAANPIDTPPPPGQTRLIKLPPQH